MCPSVGRSRGARGNTHLRRRDAAGVRTSRTAVSMHPTSIISLVSRTPVVRAGLILTSSRVRRARLSDGRHNERYAQQYRPEHASGINAPHLSRQRKCSTYLFANARAMRFRLLFQCKQCSDECLKCAREFSGIPSGGPVVCGHNRPLSLACCSTCRRALAARRQLSKEGH